MFERFTDRARRVVVLAQEEARMLNHNYIGTEHILLGLVYEGNGVAARALESLGITHEAVREQIDAIIGQGQQPPRGGHLPFTPQAKKALELSLREAMQLGRNSIDTEHILLGLIRAGDGPAVQALASLGADVAGIRQQVIRLEHEHQGEDERIKRAASRAGQARRSKRKLLSQLLGRFDLVESRLSAVERRVGNLPGMRELDEEIALVRTDKESAIDAQDFEAAAALRDREKQLLGEKATRQDEWTAAHPELPSLSDDVERLRDLLRQHGIEPRDGAA